MKFSYSSIRRHTKFKFDWSSDLCFFYSSRRRHTRFKCDWSSDVCSSDLVEVEDPAVSAGLLPDISVQVAVVEACDTGPAREEVDAVPFGRPAKPASVRSEERRVGKEGRSRWSPYH